MRNAEAIEQTTSGIEQPEKSLFIDREFMLEKSRLKDEMHTI